MKLGCLLLGHTTYWLSVDRQAHCHRCGKRDEHWFYMQDVLGQIRNAGRE